MSESVPDTANLRYRREQKSDDSLVERLADDMIASWRKGERPLTEHFLEQYPHLQHCADAVLELVAEELALRQEHGVPVSLSVLVKRFPQFPDQLKALIECQRTLGTHSSRHPAVGEALGEFQLVSVLGRGAHARVFLASQPALDNRLVVLKLGPYTGQEHLSLARLQHSNIVPLYSVHEFPLHGLRGLCLPYFGGSTLTGILTQNKRNAQSVPSSDVPGALHLNTCEGTESPADCRVWELLKTASFGEAICWIGACLAEALQYAHDRGILHLDLKPSNILIASDGVPMLLDFHLARPPLKAGDSPPAWLGGTHGYMAPEQLAAVEAVRVGKSVPQDLDARADIYSLGVVLKESLEWMQAEHGVSSASVGLRDILARCTVANPQARYPTALSLANDLKRHLANRSLSGVPNRSLAERWRKWRRRRPHALPAILALCTLIAIIAGLTLHTERLADRASHTLRDGQAQLMQGRYAESLEAFRGGELLLEWVPFHRELLNQLHESRERAEVGKTAVDLHLACEQIRPFYAAEFATPLQSQLVEQRCQELWEQRESLTARLTGRMKADMERQWRADLLDAIILAYRLRERVASPAEKRDIHLKALQTLEQAEILLGANGILYLERARHARDLGQYTVAQLATSQAQAHHPENAWDHLVLGRYYLSAGDSRRAIVELNRCLERDPQSLWGHYYKGICCLQLGHAIEAVAEFSACTILAPNTAWCIHNLGQAYTEVGELEAGLASFDRALALEPGLAASYLERAMIYQRKSRYADALADLRSAADGGISVAEVEYRKALVYLASGDRSASIASLHLCLERDPRHVKAQETLNKVAGGR